ncbi:MAG: PAC2 family protein [Chloroflexi bacterium]|nr:PAC2 family protein [Chloroflexota bacterium]
MSEDLGPLVLFDRPQLRRPALLCAFTGWPDAGEVATGALRYLAAKLNAHKLGHIAMDDFADYVQTRPLTLIERGIIQVQRQPTTDLYHWANPAGERDLLIMLSAEPQLHWHGYGQTVLRLMDLFGADLLVSLGGLYDAVPHTAEPRVSGLATTADLRSRLEELGVSLTDYEGPSSIHTALTFACHEAGKESVSLWGHAPAYVRAVANPKVCHALLVRLCGLLPLPLNLDDLKAAGEYLDETLNRLLAQNEGLRLYVRKLEEQAEGERPAPPADAEQAEDTDRILRDVEEYLRREQHWDERG